MKQLVRQALLAVAPQWVTAIMSARTRAYSQRLLARWGAGAVNRKLFDRLGCRVLDGPFEGLILTRRVEAEQAGPYLLGIYEREIHEALDVAFRSQYRQVIDIGAKFGYYAVGLARRYPDAEVVAFDTDWWAREALDEMVAANACTNVTVKGFCSRAWLARHLRPGALIVSDCEGYETRLLLPEPARAMRSATLIIETHDDIEAGASDRLRAAFSATHHVRTFQSDVSRTPPPVLDFLPPEERQFAFLEVRPATAWLLCVPREPVES